MSEFMDSFLQPLNRKNCSYVKDTTDFLNKVRKIHNSPDIEKIFPWMSNPYIQIEITKKALMHVRHS